MQGQQQMRENEEQMDERCRKIETKSNTIYNIDAKRRSND